MIISDLNYLEVVNQKTGIVGGTGGFDFNKKVESNVTNIVNFDTNIDFDKYKDVDIDVKSNLNIKGNLAELVVDAEAIGKDTLVEVESSVLAVEDKLSSVSLSAISGVNGGY